MKTFFYSFLYAIAMGATIYYNGMNDTRAKMVSMAALGLLFVLAWIQRLIAKDRPKVFSKWLLWLVIALAINIVYGSNKGIGFDDINFFFNMDVALPLIAAFSSYYLFDIKRDKFALYMLPVCAFASYCAVASVLTGLGDFVVSDNYDDEIAKNQIGIAFVLFAIICAVFAIEEKRIVIKIPYFALSLLCVYPALFFSCRTALLAYFSVVIFLLFWAYRWKSLIILPLFVVTVLLVGGNDFREMLFNSIVGNRDINDIDNLTAGRVTHAKLSFDYFLQHPLFGFYGSSDGFNQMPPNAHIFILYRLTKWGILGSIPFIALYVSIFKIFIKGIRSRELLIIGILFLAFLESFSEYAPPFGPGSSFIVAFIIIGYFLRQETKKI